MKKIVWAVFFLIFLAESNAFAQACCSATSAGEAGVVGRCHKAMIQVGGGIDHGTGVFTETSDYEGFESTGSDDIIFSVAGGIRPFDRRFRVGAMAPLHLQHRSSDDLSSTKTKFGDVAWSSGFLFLEDPMAGISESWIPFLEVALLGTFPTGTHLGESTDPLAADVTSAGGTTLGGGLRLVKFLTPAHALRLSGDYRYSFSHDVTYGRNTVEVQPGAEWGGLVGWNYERSLFWSVGAYTRFTYTENLRTQGNEVEDSDRQRLTLGGIFRRSIVFPYWDVNLSLGTDLLMGKNLPRAGVAGSFSIQRNFL